MTANPFASATRVAALIRRRRGGALEQLNATLQRVAALNPRINAVIALRVDAARKEARAIDRALARGEKLGLLAGVAMTVKESFNVAGLPTTWGLEEYKGRPVAEDALSVRRLKAAGAVIFGKTNVPVLLADWQTFNPVYGTTNNPYDVTRVPGGSSGGAAAALAAGITGLEMGSDIGASIRDPAHYCGVYGHKPTYGICSPQGHALPGSVAAQDISVIGPLARSADDLKLALGVIAGPDAIDARGWRLALPKPRKTALKDFRIGVMLSHPTAEADASVQTAIDGLAQWLGKQKAKVDYNARPDFDPDEAHRVFLALVRSATSGRQSPQQFARWADLAARRGAADMSYEAQAARGNTLLHKDWLGLNERRHQLRLAWARFFETFDVLLCPAATTPAFAHNQNGERWERMLEVNGKPQPTTTQMFWAGYSGMCYLPSTVAPVGFSNEGLPVGVQIVGPQYGDLTTIELARQIERGYGGFVAPQGFE